MNLLRAELFRLVRRPLVWALFGVSLSLLLLQLLASVVFAGLFQGMLVPAQLAEYQRRANFPGVFGNVFGHINGLGGFLAVILAGAAMGSEYGWGTLRTTLMREPSRVRYGLAKCGALLLLLLLAIVLHLVIGGVLGLALRTLLPALNSGALDPLALPSSTLRALLVLLPYTLLSVAAAVITRSALGGVAIGIGYLLFEAGFGALAIFAQLGGVWELVYNLTIGQNINTLVLLNSRAFGLQPEALTPALSQIALPPPLQATLVVLVYSAVALATTLYVLGRRDVGGAG